MIEKIKAGIYFANLCQKRLCDVLIYVGGNNEPTTIEHINYDEYEEIKEYLS